MPSFLIPKLWHAHAHSHPNRGTKMKQRLEKWSYFAKNCTVKLNFQHEDH